MVAAIVELSAIISKCTLFAVNKLTLDLPGVRAFGADGIGRSGWTCRSGSEVSCGTIAFVSQVMLVVKATLLTVGMQSISGQEIDATECK